MTLLIIQKYNSISLSKINLIENVLFFNHCNNVSVSTDNFLSTKNLLLCIFNILYYVYNMYL